MVEVTENKIHEAQRIHRTAYGQRILDTICDKVLESNGLGHIGWAIGETDVVVDFVTHTLGRTRRSVAGALSHLIDAGLLSNESTGDETMISRKGFEIGVTHDGWMAYSGWDETKLVAHSGDGEPASPITIDDWLEWDGIDGTNYPYDAPMAFPY